MPTSPDASWRFMSISQTVLDTSIDQSNPFRDLWRSSKDCWRILQYDFPKLTEVLWIFSEILKDSWKTQGTAWLSKQCLAKYLQDSLFSSPLLPSNHPTCRYTVHVNVLFICDLEEMSPANLNPKTTKCAHATGLSNFISLQNFCLCIFFLTGFEVIWLPTSIEMPWNGWCFPSITFSLTIWH